MLVVKACHIRKVVGVVYHEPNAFRTVAEVSSSQTAATLSSMRHAPRYLAIHVRSARPACGVETRAGGVRECMGGM